jgi:hypothetical protein
MVSHPLSGTDTGAAMTTDVIDGVYTTGIVPPEGEPATKPEYGDWSLLRNFTGLEDDDPCVGNHGDLLP